MTTTMKSLAVFAASYGLLTFVRSFRRVKSLSNCWFQTRDECGSTYKEMSLWRWHGRQIRWAVDTCCTLLVGCWGSLKSKPSKAICPDSANKSRIQVEKTHRPSLSKLRWSSDLAVLDTPSFRSAINLPEPNKELEPWEMGAIFSLTFWTSPSLTQIHRHWYNAGNRIFLETLWHGMKVVKL